MPDIPRAIGTVSPGRQSSVGRLRVDAPVEAFGGGAAAQGLAQVGRGLQSMGAGAQRIAQRQEQVKDKADKSDILRAKTDAANIYNRAAVQAKFSKNSDEVKRLFAEAKKATEKLNDLNRSTDAKTQYSEWLMGEHGRRSNQELAMVLSTEERVTQVQDESTRNKLITTSIDENSLANNKSKLGQFWSKSELSEAEIEKGLTDDLRLADKTYADNIVASIDPNADTALDMQRKLNTYEAFLKNSNSLTPADRTNGKLHAQRINKQIEMKSEDEFVNQLVANSVSKSDPDDIKSEAEQQETLEFTSMIIDQSPDFKDEEQRSRAKGKVHSILKQKFNEINNARKQEIYKYIDDPSLDIGELQKNEALTVDEQAAVGKIYTNRLKASGTAKIRGSINQEIQDFDYENATSSDLIMLLSKVETLSSPERKVYKELINNKRDAIDKGENYSKAYTKLESILTRRYRLIKDGKSSIPETAKITVGGSTIEMDITERALAFARDARALREIGEEFKGEGKRSSFDNAVKEFMDVENTKYLDQIKEDQFRENR